MRLLPCRIPLEKEGAPFLRGCFSNQVPTQVAQGNQRKVKISVTNKMTEYMGALQVRLEMNSL